MSRFHFFICALLLLIFTSSITAQEADKLVVKPVLIMNTWSTYTTGEQVFNANTKQFEAVDNRLNFLLRRSRIGLKGSYDTNWVYDFTTSLDDVGGDILAGSVSGGNNGASPSFRIWNALMQYKVSKSEALYLTTGYMIVQVSRESITSPFVVNSFDKAWSQNYIRRHITGAGPGRLVGLNLGGMTNTADTKFAFSYDLGIYNPRYMAYNGNSAGTKYAPLLTYRLATHIGDPEFAKYSRSHKFNFNGKRNGVTLAISGSYEGASNLWDSNSSFGLDVLANFGAFNIAGEWMQLYRSLGEIATYSSTGVLKLGYYTTVKEKGWEPVLMYCFFKGPTAEQEENDARSLNAFFGIDNYIELTMNYYVSSKVRLSIAYTMRHGDSGETDPSTVINNYFQQGGVGAIQRGNYLGLGLLFSL